MCAKEECIELVKRLVDWKIKYRDITCYTNAGWENRWRELSIITEDATALRLNENAKADDALYTKVKFPEVDSRISYDELLRAVETRYPGETRHETALRYIKERERSHGTGRSDSDN